MRRNRTRRSPSWFVDMDRDLSIAACGAQSFLRAVAATFSRGLIKVHSVARVNSDIGQLFTFRAGIAVAVRHVGELLDAIEIAFRKWVFLHAKPPDETVVWQYAQTDSRAVASISGQR